MTHKPKIPVLIITGFLGSGKTSLINYLLFVNRDTKIGIIENEFGERSIDSKLIAGFKPEQILELNNGCICCSIFNEFSLALQELVKKHDHLEQLLIETTGVADPGPIIEPFFRDPDLIRLFELKGTICLVDALHFADQILTFEQKKQIIMADLIIMNKVADIPQERIREVHQKIQAINPVTPIIETNFSRIDDPQFYLLQSDIHDNFARKIRRPLYSEPEVSDFYSFTIRFSGNLNPSKFKDWFTHFAAIHRSEIYRIKGIVNWKNEPLTGVVQSVAGTVSITEGSVVNPYESTENVMVFIGRNISKYDIEKEVRQFLLQEN